MNAAETKMMLIVHIAAGMTAFFIAPGALFTVKGGLWHRRWGKIYFWAMAVVALTAILMATIGVRPNQFLAAVAVFSFYNAFSGYRVLRRKRPAKGEGPRPMDCVA